MKKDEITSWAVPYSKKCENCQKVYTLYTQSDNAPEYYTDVFIECDCGDFIPFELPVN